MLNVVVFVVVAVVAICYQSEKPDHNMNVECATLDGVYGVHYTYL